MASRDLNKQPTSGVTPVPKLDALGEATTGHIVAEWPLQPGNNHELAVRGGIQGAVQPWRAKLLALTSRHLRRSHQMSRHTHRPAQAAASDQTGA